MVPALLTLLPTRRPVLLPIHSPRDPYHLPRLPERLLQAWPTLEAVVALDLENRRGRGAGTTCAAVRRRPKSPSLPARRRRARRAPTGSPGRRSWGAARWSCPRRRWP